MPDHNCPHCEKAIDTNDTKALNKVGWRNQCIHCSGKIRVAFPNRLPFLLLAFAIGNAIVVIGGLAYIIHWKKALFVKNGHSPAP